MSKSIVETHPDIAKQWHPTKNGDLKPEMFTYGMHVKVWWLCEKKCPKGCLHEWETFIDSRTYFNRGCPFCCDPPVKQCIHMSIVETHPEIVKQWHPTKNGDLKPENYSFGSSQKVWWLCEKKCPKGCLHEWETTINSRCGIKEANCPYCLENPKKICKHMSISETHPNIIKIWHPTKNNDLTPEMFSSGSSKKVWWLCENKCPKGCLHEWEATISNISKEKSGCPFCSIPCKKSCKHMSILETNPEVVKQWHPTKNRDLKPESFTSGSAQKIWWLCDKKCPKGCLHEWETSISNRCNTKETGCPYCCYPVLKICKHNSIIETHPEIAKQWHPLKNGNLKPEMFSFGSGVKVWWLCDKKCPEGCLHEWETDIQHRTSRESDCPYCCKAPRKLCEHTSIVETHPDIAKQWHPTKNGDLKPENYSFGSGTEVWWLCEKTCPEGCLHEWKTSILDRCGSKESGCPYCCEPRRKLCEHISIVETHPDIAKQWHPIKNGDLKPEMFSFGSGVKVWWLCEKTCPKGCLHEWETTISSRSGYGKSNCPFCCKSIQKFCEHISVVETHPDIIKQWHPTKNGDLRPENFRLGSSVKVWWLCDKNHEWEASFNKRCGSNKGCPVCKYKTEEKLKLYLDNKFSDLIFQFKEDWCKYESNSSTYFRFDFLIKNFNLIIELDGEQHFEQISNWTSPEITILKDVYKMKKALEKGYTILRIRRKAIWENDEKWLDINLLPYISKNQISCVIYLEESNIYHKHQELMLK